MILMRHVVIALFPMVFFTHTALAASPASSADFTTLKKEFDDAEIAFRDVVRKQLTRDQAAGKRLYIPFDETPPARFAARFLEYAEQNPNDPHALEALERAVAGTHTNPPLRGRAIERLRASYVTSPEIKRLIYPLIITHDDESDRLVYEIIARNPDREVRVFAYKALIHRAEAAIQLAERIESDEHLRKDMEANEGKSYVERSLAHGKRGPTDLEAYTTIARELFPDRFPNLSIGRPAPELVGRTLDDHEVKLSDYRGKVVVLDIWATWCGPCREMIPHEREMVARLKDKPFVLVSISVDQEKKTLVDFLARERMPWTHWWNGSEGKVIDALDVDHFPTIFVLDTKGVIRAKEVRGTALEEAVGKLLDEIDAE